MAKHIGVFVTGGIAAYKVPALVRQLIKQGAEVRVAMTAAAGAFVTEGTLATVSKHAVLTDANEFAAPEHVAHVALAHWLDQAIVVPATANTIAKLACGMADNVVTTTLLAFAGQKLLVPAMNDQMWQNAQTQANVAHLQAAGWHVLPPAAGFLAEGYAGVGRMPEPAQIALFAQLVPDESYLSGQRVVVTAGGTRERIDPVRYLSNDSSGKMGTAIANAAAAAGGTVALLTTASQLTLPQVTVQPVGDARSLQAALEAQYETADILVMAAAVADYRPLAPAAHKLKKQGEAGLTLQLTQNPDILAGLGQAKTHQFLVGFAAETDDLLANAKAKLAAKHVDLLVANPVGAGQGFNTDDNTVTLLWPDGTTQALAPASKLTVAQRLLEAIAEARQ